MKLFIFIAIVFFAGPTVHAQCVATTSDPCVAVHQSILDRTAKALDELKDAKDALAKYAALTPLTEAERAAYKTLVVALGDAFDARGKMIADMQNVINIQAKALDLYSQLVEKLTAAMNKKQSGFQKFAAAVEKILYLAAGIAFGRGL